MEERGINPNPEENLAEVLDSILQQFYAEVRNKRGESYKPESLKVMTAGSDSYLREQDCPFLKKKHYGKTASLFQVVLEFSVTPCGRFSNMKLGVKGMAKTPLHERGRFEPLQRLLRH